MKKVLLGLLCLAMCLTSVLCAACNNNSAGSVALQFGEFSYKGKTLKEYAVNTITASQAKKMLNEAKSKSVYAGGISVMTADVFGVETMSLNMDREEYLPTDEVVDKVLFDYAGCNITTKYYTENSDDLQTKTDKVTGFDFKSILKQNYYVPFNQLVAKNVLVFDDLIDYMEEQNRAFAASDMGLVAPFKTIFSYHTDANGNLIIQTRDYAEIASSVGGGIGCSYRQDTEIVYDRFGKMTLWQTSLGISSSTPQGTLRDGYILEMSVEWVEKI